MNNEKLRSKAMTIVVGVSGVEGATIQGDSKDELEVTGEGVDSVRLTSLLRKKFGHAELVSVGDVGKAEEKKVEEIVTWPYTYSVPHYPVYQIRNSYQYEDPSCSIM
ncbi:ATFP4-like protein [Trifolium pratense]|uniref:ATFP4-like protein n=1 Tax=Trifolium pratense TaxID=57577 RepID=A0A2K3KVJ8_TRIPR|nr:ATFP4-like protein [Trifolium pratense]